MECEFTILRTFIEYERGSVAKLLFARSDVTRIRFFCDSTFYHFNYCWPIQNYLKACL